MKTLKNGEATRQSIIDSFRGHLGQAGKGDVALLYFSGHGSQEQSPEEFWKIEPDHLDETLVCVDSRTPGCWDLADKEIAKLIGEVAAKGPHVAVILDCCHCRFGHARDRHGRPTCAHRPPATADRVDPRFSQRSRDGGEPRRGIGAVRVSGGAARPVRGLPVR